MLVLILIRLLRDALCLVAAIGFVLTVGSDNQDGVMFPAVVSLLMSVAWFFVLRKEWAMTDRRNLKSRSMRFTASFSN